MRGALADPRISYSSCCAHRPRSPKRLFSLFAFPLLLGCAGLFAVEGANPGECADETDNDGDALADCLDSDCAATPSCIGIPEADADADADPTFDTIWDSSGVTLNIGGDDGGYSFGMSEGGENGWTGEDCLDGMGGFVICHDDVSEDGITLETVFRPSDVEPNLTTLLGETSSNAGSVTYMVQGDTDCWTWGNDPGVYEDALDCISD